MNLHRLIYSFFSKHTLPYWGIVLLDLFFIFFSMLVVYGLNNGPLETIESFKTLFFTLAVYSVLFLVGFKIFRTYSGILRYSTFIDLQRVGFATAIGLALDMVVKYTVGLEPPFLPIRSKEIILGGLIGMVLMWIMRIGAKHIYEKYYRNGKIENIFILGIREGGISIAKSIRAQEPIRYEVVGFTSEREAGRGKVLMGRKVYPFDDNLPMEMKKEGATALFVSPLRTDTLRNNQHMVDLLIRNGIRIFIANNEQQWDGKGEIPDRMMREVKVEDLLPRQQITVDESLMKSELAGKSILITGAAGSIGSEIVRQVASFGPSELMLIDQAETPLHDVRLILAKEFPDIKAQTVVADICCRERMDDIFRRSKPEYVFHAAAYKHVPMMEDNPGESVRNNVLGTKIIADLAVDYGVKKFVMISTDKAVNPTNVMGCSKRICEIYVQSLDRAEKEGKRKGKTQFITTRFGNVLGSNGSVIPLFYEQIKNGGPITVTHPDIIRFFMLIPEACLLVLEAATKGEGGEIFLFDMGEPVKIVDLAKRMIKLSGRDDIEIKFTGLRDGEKLYEEVLNDKETTLPTFNPKIRIASVREYDYDAVCRDIDDLIAVTGTYDNMKIVAKMKEIVPEYISQHSVYEALDNKKP